MAGEAKRRENGGRLMRFRLLIFCVAVFVQLLPVFLIESRRCLGYKAR